MTTLARWLKRFLVALLVLLVAAVLAGWLAVRASLPRTDGTVKVPGLTAPVTIERDGRGVPVISGASRLDVFRGQGFVHGQDRYFQMDLWRSLAAGELAGLVGEAALEMDRGMRKLGYRRRAAETLAALPESQRAALAAYTEGVNAGLADLGVRPPEYFLLGQRPRPWTAEDSVVILFFFYAGLSHNHVIEKPLGVMHELLPPALFEFLTPDTTRFDTPLSDEPLQPPLLVPGPDVVDLRGTRPPRIEPGREVIRPLGLHGGSNSWAVAGSRTGDGRAILANDTHMTLTVPNTWYRVTLKWDDHEVHGVSPAGVPGVTAGASTALAWGMTNSGVDHMDWIVIETPDGDDGRYLTPEGPEPFTEQVEEIAIRGGDVERLVVRQTRWGPVVDEDWRGRPLVLRSAVFEPGGINFDLLDMVEAASLDEGMAIAASWRGPSLNWMLADAGGRIAWVLGGHLPRRAGFDGKVPTTWSSGERRWDGVLDESQRPVLVDPPGGVLFTANQRTMPWPASRQYTHAWMWPIRAHRLAEIFATPSTQPCDELGMQQVQLDTRAPGHDFVRDLVLEIVPDDEPDSRLARARRHAADWNGTANADQVGFRILHAFYLALFREVLTPLLAPALAADDEFVYPWPLADEPVRRILETRPDHLLPPGHDDWRGFLRTTLANTLRGIHDDAATPDIDEPWGLANRAAIRHPVGAGLPLVGGRFAMRPDPLPGWAESIRSQTPDYGANFRMVVSPGRFDEGFFHMPCGQSGHLLSRHFDDGHAAWVHGLATPLRPGPTVSTVVLEP